VRPVEQVEGSLAPHIAFEPDSWCIVQAENSIVRVDLVSELSLTDAETGIHSTG
jgi:hypothetical protein